LKDEIKSKTLVGLREQGDDRGMTERLQGWINYHGRGPFTVCQRPDREHVSLLDKKGNLIHFGSTGCCLLHIGYVEPWRQENHSFVELLRKIWRRFF